MNKRYLRSIQTRFPAIRTTKFRFKNFATRNFGMFIDRDFLLLRDLKSVDLAVDVGGNWGQSIYAFKSLTRPRHIISFEPSPHLSQHLAKTFRGDPGVRIEPTALGKSAGSFELYTPEYQGYVWDGLASTIREEASEWLSPKTLAWFDPARLSIVTDTVEVRTLDSYALNPDVLKIDVQGGELAVVEGGLETLRRTRPITLIEDPKPELVDLLATLDLYPFKLDGKSLVRNDFASINTVFLSAARLKDFSDKGYEIL